MTTTQPTETRKRTAAKKTTAEQPQPPDPITPGQLRLLAVLMDEQRLTDRAEALAWVNGSLDNGRVVESRKDLTKTEAGELINLLHAMTPPRPPSVFEAVIAAKRDLPAVGKHGRNIDQGYAFRSIDDVVNAIAPVLAKHGLFYAPSTERVETSERPTRSGGTQIMAVATVRYTVYGPGGDCFEAVTVGQGLDTSDKSINKAATGAYKTFLTQTFAIPFQSDEQDYTSPEAEQVPDNATLLKQLDEYAATAHITRAAITAKWRAANGGLSVEALESLPSDRLYPLVRSIGAYLAQQGTTDQTGDYS